MKRTAHLGLPLLVLIMSVSPLGCNSPAPSSGPPAAEEGHHDHDHDGEDSHGEHPETYADAVATLDELRTDVKDAFAANDLEKADGPVHEFGHVLEELPALAEKASLTQVEQDEIKTAVEDLFDCFGRIDDRIHSGKGATYEEVSEEIDAALATLRRHAREE
jgi:hypothetical protein